MLSRLPLSDLVTIMKLRRLMVLWLLVSPFFLIHLSGRVIADDTSVIEGVNAITEDIHKLKKEEVAVHGERDLASLDYIDPKPNVDPKPPRPWP